ncbi:uncharacterized protein [Montipora foliosa]|uniref:uncharacterized protein n=1 Tax=Montipora foliosa TaxID=591990 RepID=UPI0035F15A91
MAEGKDYEEVLTEEEDQIKVPFEGAEEKSKEATGGSPEENLELKGAHEGDDADDDESHGADCSRLQFPRSDFFETAMISLKSKQSADCETIENQESLLQIVEEEEYETIKERVTATALMNCDENTLLLAIKVSEKLRERAARNEAAESDFNALAEQVEEFTLRFLDPLKHFNKNALRIFCGNPELDIIFETATKLGQKKCGYVRRRGNPPKRKALSLDLPAIDDRIQVFQQRNLSSAYSNQKQSLKEELENFLYALPGRETLFDAIPFDVCRFRVYNDAMGKTQPHRNGCPYTGQRGVFSCHCPRRLSYNTVDSYIGKLRSIFSAAGRQGDWNRSLHLGNPASDELVKLYLKQVAAEQLQAHVTPKHAIPIFPDKLLLLSCHLEKRLLLPNLSPSEMFVVALDLAFFKCLFYAGDRAGDLGLVKTPEIARFPDDSGFLFNHVWGKALRDGSSNLFGMRRHPNPALCPIRAVEMYVAVSREIGFEETYKAYFTIPYFVFLREMISYLALVALHIAICLESSQLSLSGLEWAISVFFCGLLLVEGKQIADIARSEDKKMRLKELKTYLRAFGSLLEAFEGVGTIQIALFQIIRDVVVVVVHFAVITVAFSSTITKVFLASTGVQDDPKKYSWLGITSQLGLSLLDLSDGLDYFRSADSSSETLAHCLFAAYLVIALIILVNMLIALLSNTYQKVQDYSRREWAFQKAVTIQTYRNHHPIPVPFNIMSTFLILFPCLRIKKKTLNSPEDMFAKIFRMDQSWERELQEYYRLQYGGSFPFTEPLQQMAEETNNTESMVIKILHKTFTSDKALLPTGPEAWEAHNDILVEGCLLTCQSMEASESCFSFLGAKYRSSFSRRFPHFEVMTLKSEKKQPFGDLTLGVVCESWDCKTPPQLGGTVAFRTNLKIFDFDDQPDRCKAQVTGVDAIRRGDVIRCTVMFECEEERDGKFHVPVVFTVNGTRIKRQGCQRFIKSRAKPDEPLYPFIGFYNESSVLAKMCARDDVDYQDLQLQEVKSELTEAKGELSEVKSQLNDVRVQLREATSKLDDFGRLRLLEEKLDAVLAKVGEKQNE